MTKDELELVQQILEAEQAKARARLEELRAAAARIQAEVEAILNPPPPKETPP